ncbi:MAG TPA: hypothetical protein VIX17_08620 [Pyrinomonadaceae bacterium]
MRALVPLLLLLPFTALAQRPVTQKQVLVDFRQNRITTPPKITPATQKFVLSKVFRRYLTDENKCNPNFAGNGVNDYLKAARNAGQIVPAIVDSVTGSFTAAGQAQTLYVISVSECNASHADNFGTKRVAIFNGQQLVADVDVDFRNSIVKKLDLNVDGIDELLMTSGDMAQGTLIEMASLLSFENGRVKMLEDFGTVTEDSCASGFPGSTAKGSVIWIAPVPFGQIPKLRQDNYESSCRNVKKWRFISTGKMQ